MVNENICSELPPGSIQTLLQEIINEQGFKKYQINVAKGSNKGDNYLGKIHRVDIVDENDENNKLNLIFKCSTRNKNFRNTAPYKDIFSREAYLYQNVFPAFEDFEKSLGVQKPFSSYAKLYKSCAEEMEEVLIMDNKKEQGYVMKERKTTLNFEDCRIVLEELGHLHAISFAMKKLKPELFKSLTEKLYDILGIWLKGESCVKQIKKMGTQGLKSINKIENTDAYKKFSKFNENIIEYLIETVDAVDEYAVVTHGDTWSSNILFRYQNPDHDAPSDVCLLDWQISQYGSPMRDVSYFIYNCTNKELRDQNFDNMIQIYYNSLSDRLTEMGCDVNVLFPFSVLELQMKKYFRYGLIMSCFLIHLFTSDSDEIPDLEDIVNNTEDETIAKNISIVDSVDFESRNVHLYNERVSGNILHAIEREFI